MKKFFFLIFPAALILFSCSKKAEVCEAMEPTTPIQLSANFIVENNADPTEGLPAKLINQSTGAVSYAWDFGNGDLSSEKDPVFTFSGCGNHDVVLTVTDAKGSKKSLTSTLTIKCGGKHAPQNP